MKSLANKQILIFIYCENAKLAFIEQTRPIETRIVNFFQKSYPLISHEKEPAVVAERFRACVKFK